MTVTDKVTQWNKQIADNAENLQATLLLNEAVLPAQLSLTGYGSVQVYDVGMTIKNSRAQMQQLDAINAKHFSCEASRSDELDFKVDWIMYLAEHYKPDRKLARKLGEELLARCRDNQNRQQAMTVLVHLAQNWMTLGDMPQAKRCFDEAYSMFDEKLDYHLADEYGTDAKSQNLSLSAEVDLMMGQIETAYSKLDEALVHGRKIGHQASVIFAHIVVAQVAAFLQDYDKVIETTEAFEAYNGGKESYFNHYLYLYYYCAKDDITAARGALDQLVEQGQLFAISYYATHVVDVYLRLGDVEEATQLMEQTLQRGIDNDDIGAFPFLKQTMAQCYYQMDGDLTPRVIKLFEQAIADAKQQHAYYFELENTVYLWTLYHQHQHPNLKNLDGHYLKELRAKVSIPANSRLSQAFEKLNA